MQETHESAIQHELTETIDEQFDGPLFWLLAALLLFMPAALGTFRPWNEGIALAMACGLAALLSVKLLLRPHVRFVWSWAYLPIALFFLIVIVQLVPLPAEVARMLSPQTVATKTALLSEMPDAAQRLQHVSLNFYHEAAWHDLRLLVAVTIVFVVTVNAIRSVDQMKRLLWVIACIGTAEAVLAIVQIMTGATDVYWYFPLWGAARPNSGTFPNHNFFSQFMNLSSGATLGLLLMTMDQTFRRRDYTPGEVIEKLSSPEFRKAWLLAAMLAVSEASVFLSLSRGGVLSLAVAGAIVGVLLAIRGGARGMGITGWVAGVLLLVVFCIVVAGGAKLVQDRFTALGDPENQFDRPLLTKDTLKMWRDYPVLGTGLGSYRHVFPKYDDTGVEAVAVHAENEYVEVLAETGVAGAICVAGFLAIIAACFFRARARGRRGQNGPSGSVELIDHRNRSGRAGDMHSQEEDPAIAQLMHRESPDKGSRGRSSRGRHGSRRRSASSHGASPTSSLALGLGFGLIAILVHSAADFGEHFLSVACLTAVACGLLVNLARSRRRERGLEFEGMPARASLIGRIAGVVAVVVISVLVLAQAASAWSATTDWDKAEALRKQLTEANWKGEQGDLIDLLRFDDAAVKKGPGEIKYHFWRAMDRFNSISDVFDPVSGTLVFSPEKREKLQQLHDDLNQARWICPTFGPLYAQIGQWEMNFLDRPIEGGKHFRMGVELAPGDSSVVFIAGTLYAEEGNWKESLRLFQQAANLSPGTRADAIDLYVGYFNRPELALDLAGDNVDQLRSLSRKLRERGKNPPTTSPATQPADEAVAVAADKRMDDVIRASADDPDAPASVIAEMGLLCLKRGQTAQAIPYLDRAVGKEYGRTDWRLQYALALESVGRNEDAIHQAKVILLLSPRQSEALDLIDRLSMPATHAISPSERGAGE